MSDSKYTQLQIVALMCLASRGCSMAGVSPCFNFESIACIASADQEKFDEYLKMPEIVDLVTQFESLDGSPEKLINLESLFRQQFAAMTASQPNSMVQ